MYKLKIQIKENQLFNLTFTKTIFLTFSLFIFAFTFVACGDDENVESTVLNESDEIEIIEKSTPYPDDDDQQTIAEIAVAGGFNTLVAALDAADLVETLSGEGKFTVFAPTDEAFAALPEGMLDELLADTDALTQILLYHVVGDVVMAEQVVTLDEAETLQGSKVAIEVVDGNVFINESQVTTTDIEASNGVIHVIDAVLLPEMEDLSSRKNFIEGQLPNYVVFQYKDPETDYTYRRLVIRDIINTVLENSSSKNLISQQIPVGIFETSEVRLSSVNSQNSIEIQIPQVF